MGLDIVCSCGEISFRAGSYTGFGTWREALASTVGINLHYIRGYGGDGELDYDAPFVELLNHSDCEDELTPDQCRRLLEDFEEYAENFREHVDDKNREYYVAKYILWHEAVKHSAENGCPVCGRRCNIIFC